MFSEWPIDVPSDVLSEAEIERLSELPFVETAESGVCFWQPACSGYDDDDCARGEIFATMTLAIAKEMDSALAVAVVLRDMVRMGRFGAVEAGFLATVSGAARAGRMH